MRFYLGTHEEGWLSRTDVPLFLSRRRLVRRNRRRLPRAIGRWALDSGGFTELSMFGEWRTPARQYAADVERFADEIGGLDWAAPQDWMCEPFVLKRTGGTVESHQLLTTHNYLELRERTELVIPVLQGYTVDDYLRHVDQYRRVGVELDRLPLVGVGSVCRRSRTLEACTVVRRIAGEGIRVHAFGVKGEALLHLGDVLESADSMAWSSRGRRSQLVGCTHKSCGNCLRFALRWRGRLLDSLGQQRLEVSCAG